jgi:hypothetical protein
MNKGASGQCRRAIAGSSARDGKQAPIHEMNFRQEHPPHIKDLAIRFSLFSR